MSIIELSPQEVNAGLNAGDINLVDVREPIEFYEERIHGAMLFPLSQFNPTEVLNMHKESTKPKLVLHCRSGKRALDAANQLVMQGLSEVYLLRGSIIAWKEAGMPLLSSSSSNPKHISIMRQVQIAAGSLILSSVLLGFLLSDLFFILAGLIGAGLLFAGLSGYCGMALLLARLPFNKNIKF